MDKRGSGGGVGAAADDVVVERRLCGDGAAGTRIEYSL
jgi:hypothetical protein